MPRLFISYRREDSAAHAGRIYNWLVAEFGAAVPFMDVDNIPPGANFRTHVAATIATCDALLVVIGRQWLSLRDNSGRLRLSDPNDPVASEIALGHEQNVRIIPLLVGGAKMLEDGELHFVYSDDRGGEPSQFVVRKLKQGE